MTLIKTSLLTGISTIVKVITVFIINKIVSIYIGPSGLALIGQFQNFVSIISTYSNGAISQGIIKYTAEYSDYDKKVKIFSTSLVMSLFYSIVISFILLAFRNFWSEFILNDIKYSDVFLLFGLTTILFSLNTMLFSILNGQKEIKKYVIINIISSVLLLILTIILTIKLNVMGALYAIILNQSAVFFVTLFFVIKSSWFNSKYFSNGIDKEMLLKLSKFSLMAMTGAITTPIAHIIVRNHIGDNISWEAAGYWQAIWYISTIYLLLITTSLSIYYLPRLSEIQEKLMLKKEILSGYKIIMPLSISFAIIIYIFKETIIEVAFTNEFTPMLELFKWQLIGDVIKIASFLLSYIMLAKAMTKAFIFTEILGSISFVILSIMFINNYGLVGITYAFALNYILYFIVVFIIYRKYHYEK